MSVNKFLVLLCCFLAVWGHCLQANGAPQPNPRGFLDELLKYRIPLQDGEIQIGESLAPKAGTLAKLKLETADDEIFDQIASSLKKPSVAERRLGRKNACFSGKFIGGVSGYRLLCRKQHDGRPKGQIQQDSVNRLRDDTLRLHRILEDWIDKYAAPKRA